MATVAPPSLPSSSGARLQLPTLLLAGAMLSTGAAGLIMEYVLATVSTYVLGNSVEQFSMVIACMMLSMGIAAGAQRFIGQERLIEKFVAIEVLLALLGGFAPLIIYGAYASLEEHFTFVMTATVMLIGFLIGLEIPIVIRINERYTGELPANLGWILGGDFVGSFVGALFWVYVLLARYPLTEIGFLVSGFNFGVAVLIVGYFAYKKVVRHLYLVAAALALTAALLGYGWYSNRGWSMSIEQKLYDSPIVFAETTKYQRIVMTYDTQPDDRRLYLNGGLQFSSLDEAIYHEHLVHPAMTLAPSRQRVLILGGGDGLALREVLKYPDVREVLLVDIDPEMINIAANNPFLRKLNNGAFSDARVSSHASSAVTGSGFRKIYMEDEQKRGPKESGTTHVATVRVLNVDAHKFVSEVGKGPWNVVIIDFPDPDQVELAKLYSREFYHQLTRSIASDGLMVVQSTSPYHAKEAFLCIGRTLTAAGLNVVPYHTNVPSFGDWGWYIGSKTESVQTLTGRLKGIGSIPVATRNLSPDMVRASLAFGKGQLTPEFQGASSIMEPRIMQLYNRYGWQQE